MIGIEDGVIGGAGRADGVVGTVVDCQPLPVRPGDGNASRVFAPGVARIVGNRAVQFFKRAFQIAEIDHPLIVNSGGAVTASRGRVRPQGSGTNDVELIAPVNRAVHEGLGGAKTPRTGLPITRITGQVQERLALSALKVSCCGRSKLDRARCIVWWGDGWSCRGNCQGAGVRLRL